MCVCEAVLREESNWKALCVEFRGTFFLLCQLKKFVKNIANHYCSFIFSRMGVIISKLGLFPGSSFMQIRINLAICGLEPGGIETLSPSRAI